MLPCKRSSPLCLVVLFALHYSCVHSRLGKANEGTRESTVSILSLDTSEKLPEDAVTISPSQSGLGSKDDQVISSCTLCIRSDEKPIEAPRGGSVSGHSTKNEANELSTTPNTIIPQVATPTAGPIPIPVPYSAPAAPVVQPRPQVELPVPAFHFSSEFPNTRNVKEEKHGYVSIDNLHVANASRMIVPKERKVRNIFSLVETPSKSELEVKNLFEVIGERFRGGLEPHNSRVGLNAKQQPLEIVVINTNCCCSKPDLLHIQMYSGHGYAPYDCIRTKHFASAAPLYENETFFMHAIPDSDKSIVGGNSTCMVVLFKDATKSFYDFFDLLKTDAKVLRDYTEVLVWLKSNHQNIRSFMVPNCTNNPKYEPYQLPSRRFCMYVYSVQRTPAYNTI